MAQRQLGIKRARVWDCIAPQRNGAILYSHIGAQYAKETIFFYLELNLRRLFQCHHELTASYFALNLHVFLNSGIPVQETKSKLQPHSLRFHSLWVIVGANCG